jgi:hypothetical protein
MAAGSGFCAARRALCSLLLAAHIHTCSIDRSRFFIIPNYTGWSKVELEIFGRAHALIWSSSLVNGITPEVGGRQAIVVFVRG